jgi:polyribonucleotide 5'-hydroxyl-kinase
MNRRFASGTTNTAPVTVVKLDKSGGCVDTDEDFMRKSQEAAIREYFFGDLRRTLSPHTQNISFDEATIYRIQESLFSFPLLSFLPFVISFRDIGLIALFELQANSQSSNNNK